MGNTGWMPRFIRRIVALGAIVAFVAGCGGGSDGGSAGKCTASTVAAGLDAQGTVCADTGLRPSSGGFSFENWAGPVAEDAVTATTAVAIFGKEAVCAESTGDSCTPFPAVKHWIDVSNAQIQGGRCEGMAVLSQRLHDGENTPDQLQSTAAKTFDLQKPTVPVAGTISRWWVSQGFENVLQSTNRAAQMTPTEIVGKLVDAIDKKAGATIGIYANGGGHAVTPIAITQSDDGKYAIMVYDNNFPGKITSLSVDPATETWSYDIGATSAGAPSTVWSGGKGSMDYALMADREGEQKVPWSNDDRSATSKGSARITVTTGGASFAGLLITVGDKTIDTRDLSTVAAGVKVFPNRGGDVSSVGTGAMVEIPAGLKNVKVKPVVGDLVDPNDTAVDLVVGVDAPGPGSQLVTDTLSEADLGDGNYDDFTLDVSTDDGYDATLDVALDGGVEVGVAYEEESLDATLEDGQDLSVSDPAADEELSLDVTSEDGAPLYEASFDGTDDDGELSATNLDIDEATGKAVIEDEPLQAETVNDDLIAIAQADAEAAADNSPGGSTPDSVASGSSSPDSVPTDSPPSDNSVTDSSDSPNPPETTDTPSSDNGNDAPETTEKKSKSTEDPPESTEAQPQDDAGGDG